MQHAVMHSAGAARPVQPASSGLLPSSASHKRRSSHVARVQAPQRPPSTAGNGAAAPSTPSQLIYEPEDFQLPPGEVSRVDRVGKNSPADVFRCPGCTEPACQGGRNTAAFVFAACKWEESNSWVHTLLCVSRALVLLPLLLPLA